MPASPTLSRRHLLAALAAAPAGAVPFALAAQAQQAGLITGSVCRVQPETTEGPFYTEPGMVRSDIAEGRPGVPMTLRLQVVGADCRPIAGARVDVWHCDAIGIYSDVRSPMGDMRGANFLRGTQFSDTGGLVVFRTILPGWYPGRAPHIHYKVFPDRGQVLTSQLFFPARATAQVYAAHPAYRRGAPDTPNPRDGIARRAGSAAVAALDGSTAALNADLVVGLA